MVRGPHEADPKIHGHDWVAWRSGRTPATGCRARAALRSRRCSSWRTGCGRWRDGPCELAAGGRRRYRARVDALRDRASSGRPRTGLRGAHLRGGRRAAVAVRRGHLAVRRRTHPSAPAPAVGAADDHRRGVAAGGRPAGADAAGSARLVSVDAHRLSLPDAQVGLGFDVHMRGVNTFRLENEAAGCEHEFTVEATEVSS